MVIYGHELYL